ANPVKEGTKRNRVVIMFTDGAPGNWTSWQDNESRDVANAAIAASLTTKNVYGATVYTIGIFNGANANDISGRENKYMHYVSSNYPKAVSYSPDSNGLATGESPKSGYYLSAGNADALNNIFTQIANNIQNGSTTVTLGEKAVVKDIVTPQFTMPKNATDVHVYAVDCLTYDADNPTAATWETLDKAEELNDAVTIDAATKTIEVTGFDFKYNFVAENGRQEGDPTKTGTFRGRKLVIVFDVAVRDGFLGGNDVFTNGDASGVYDENDNLVENFNRPTVDVEIKPVTVTTNDKFVYFSNSLAKKDLLNGVVVKSGNVALDLAAGEAGNYGLEEWQNAYVTIGDKDTTTSYSDLTSNKQYTVKATVTPNTRKDGVTGAAQPQENSATGNVYVLMPDFTYADGYVYFGGEMPKDANYNINNRSDTITWSHSEFGADDKVLEGMVEPTVGDFTFAYSPNSGNVTTENDITVNATASKLGISFNDNFKLHVYTPTFDFADGNVYYLGQMPEEYDNATLTGWTRNGTALTTAISDKMQNKAPAIGDFDFVHSSSVTGTIKQIGDITVNVTKATVNGASLDLTNNFKLKVYTPEFTFTDSSAYYGTDAPTFEAPEPNWNNEGVTMWNDEPPFEMEFANETGKVNGSNIVVTPKNYKVNVAKIKADGTELKEEDVLKNILYKWTDDDCKPTIDGHAANADSDEFYVHVNTCSITI
ncbi:MAG: hypothetical protein IKU13_06535, partial [Clostridia bacterium]|nr:hypothetical protein [Clostridia bacterium]